VVSVTPERRRSALLPCLGIRPSVGEVVGMLLDQALDEAAARAAPGGRPVAVLDAACGRVSALRPFRERIGHLTGADVATPPPGAVTHLDDFIRADLCAEPDAFAPGTFDVILLSFAVEHLADPPAAFANLARWARPGATLVVTTVNRRHPFVGAYLGLPAPFRDRLQATVKAGPADVHRLVGVQACTTRRGLAAELRRAGWTDVRIGTVGHLARAWSRTWPTFAIGVAGDVVTAGMPARRSTLIAVARRPDGPSAP
jgi:demethylmenaquinone methyltransferase/2-methoxy-6-polyprenyl-1,4-benzoquinol methylase